MLEKVLVIANPGSGKGLAPDYARKLRDVLTEMHEAEVEIRETTEVGDAEKWATDAKADGFDTVMCLGGDGTVNEVVNGLMAVEEPPVFSFVPIGTVNDLGRVLGFEMDPEKAVQQFRQVKIDTLDIGQANERYFVDVVAVGDIPTAVMETDSDKKNQMGTLAYVVDGAKAMFDGESQTYRVTNSKGETFEFESNALIVAMTASVGGMEQLIPHRKYNDGLFQFAGLKGNVVTSGLETLVQANGVPEKFVDNDALLAFSDDEIFVEQVRVDEENPIRANVDGDEGPKLPLTVKVYKEALRVLIPDTSEEK